jgi:hypothetical protein
LGLRIERRLQQSLQRRCMPKLRMWVSLWLHLIVSK